MASYTQIAHRMKAEAGVTRHITQRKGGKAFETTIWAPQGRTIEGLYTVAHECGHIALGHTKKGDPRPRHVKEWEAEMYALAAFRRYGLEPEPMMLFNAYHYVAEMVAEDRARGIAIDPRVADFLAGKRD